jgi:flagellar protein FliO/FliZ
VAGSSVALLLRLLLSLGVVLGLMYGVTTVLKRRGFGGFAPGLARRSPVADHVEVLARKPLGRNASVAVVRAGSRAMVVGVTEANVTLLGDADLDELELDDFDAPGTGVVSAERGAITPWKTMLERLRDRTVRH